MKLTFIQNPWCLGFGVRLPVFRWLLPKWIWESGEVGISRQRTYGFLNVYLPEELRKSAIIQTEWKTDVYPSVTERISTQLSIYFFASNSEMWKMAPVYWHCYDECWYCFLYSNHSSFANVREMIYNLKQQAGAE